MILVNSFSREDLRLDEKVHGLAKAKLAQAKGAVGVVCGNEVAEYWNGNLCLFSYLPDLKEVSTLGC